MDALFVSFDASISVASFNELSGSVFSWLEEYCKPQVSEVNKIPDDSNRSDSYIAQKQGIVRYET